MRLWARFLVLACVSGIVVGQDALYQVDLGKPPTDGYAAVTSIRQRADSVVASVACGNELDFLHAVLTASNGEDTGTSVIGKLQWYGKSLDASLPRAQVDGAGHVDGVPPCSQTRIYSKGDFQGKSNQWKRDLSPNAFAGDSDTAILTGPKQFATDFHDKFVAAFQTGDGDACRDFRVDVRAGSGTTQVFSYSVPMDCLRAEMNAAIKNFDQSYGGTFHQSGTDGAVCWEKPFDKFGVPGDWDVTVRDLTRVYLLDQQWRKGWPRTQFRILSDDSRNHILNDLLTIRKGPGPDAYALDTCANASDYSTGSPDAAAADDNWLDNALSPFGPVGPDGDVWKWLLSRLLDAALITAGAPLAAGTILLGLDPATSGPVGALVGGGALVIAGGVAIGSIPETENHRLMIESSRYLYDRIAATEANDADNRARWAKYADQVRDNLLGRLQGILQHDFIEYNARPYQRYSNVALLNLYDFADDPHLKTAAQMALEYSAIKFAMAGNHGRRSVPFRRRMEVTDPVTSILDLGPGDDFQVAQMLLYAGQTQQLPQGSDNQAFGSVSGAADMVYGATSSFHPDAAVLDLAVRKDIPYYQRLSYSGTVEIYSGAASYVISAGGVLAPAAYAYAAAGAQAPAGPDWNPFIKDVDLGAAVPTTLMLASGNGERDRKSFIRIEGGYRDFGNSGSDDHKDWHNTTYDHNTCVWRGFACGMNLVDVPRPGGCQIVRENGWMFIDSSTCPTGTGKFFAAIRQEPCSRADDACAGTPGNDPLAANKGFFEIVDNPPDDFATFKTTVQSGNPSPFPDATTNRGVYHSYSGHTIEFDCSAHHHDSDKWGITSIDGVAQDGIGKWPFASGDILNSSGDGKLTFVNQRLKRQILYDFSNAANPVIQ